MSRRPVTSDTVPMRTRTGRLRRAALAKKASTKKSSKARKPAAEEPDDGSGSQARRRERRAAAIRDFEGGVKKLHAGDYASARQIFEALPGSHPAEIDIGDRARAFAKVCEERLQGEPKPPKTQRERYDLGVYHLNAGDTEQARALLGKAIEMAPDDDGAHYALAAALSIDGETARALEHLRRAIELNPDNRVQASNDSDLERLRDELEFMDLIAPPRSGRSASAERG